MNDRSYTSGVKRSGLHIAVSGLIGSGKSTLVKGLAPLLGAEALTERFERNPYLAGFYESPERWAFKSFVFFFEQSLADEAQARKRNINALQERVIEEHFAVFGEIFAQRGYLDDSEFELLGRLVGTANGLLPRSNLLLHIDIDPGEALRRIRVRNRTEERSIDVEYLQALYAQYERFVAAWSESPVVRVRAEEFDFRNTVHLSRLAMTVEDALGDGRERAHKSTSTLTGSA